MGSTIELGLLLALSEDEVGPVLAAAGDDGRLGELLGEFEADPAVFSRACELDKAWDPIACALAPEGEHSSWPARAVIGGARSLEGDSDQCWVTHLDPAEVTEVAAHLAGLEQAEFVDAYSAMPESLRNPEYGPDELAYALTYFSDMRDFYASAAGAGHHVVFTVGL